ncbi:SH3 domain-binding glutamic acid-rich-like protein 3 isoform X2 [Acanthochromis polyacanthus]|uniref:SH3 domain-binding glutamic acid-rich-like protein 3 isoform X2 n=1 Tax=Acanthochromis polyacanthus TaxID=80966 RepID=UPI000B8EF97A|nr:SH3 domain-binding glutamic acid-rich-like protein 3 isoform X2 [Acanthochromis polyacanthus]
MSLTLFYTSVSSSVQIKKSQDKIMATLESLKIPFVQVDIAQSSEHKETMRRICGNPTALPPQLARGDVYCGFKVFHP